MRRAAIALALVFLVASSLFFLENPRPPPPAAPESNRRMAARLEAAARNPGVSTNPFANRARLLHLERSKDCADCPTNPERGRLLERSIAEETAHSGEFAKAARLFAELSDPRALAAVQLRFDPRAAIATLEPREDPLSRWLLLLARSTAPREGRDLAPALGLDATGTFGAVAIADFDGDGALDVLVARTARDAPLTLKLGRRGRFAPASADLEGLVGGVALAVGDYDGDGDPDVFVARGGGFGRDGQLPSSLLRNDGGRFTDVSEEALLVGARPSRAAAFLDFDGDGRLDLYVGNESSPRMLVPSALYRNLGDGSFEELGGQAGVAAPGDVRAVAVADWDADGRPDLFVARHGGPSSLYRNQGGRFVDEARSFGIDALADLSCAVFFDADGDADLDLFVAAHASPEAVAWHRLHGGPPSGARLFVSSGGRLEPREVGVEIPMMANACAAGDFDGDGRVDLYLSTGGVALDALEPDRVFWNRGARFEPSPAEARLANAMKSSGLAVADLDGDGRPEVHVVGGGWYEGDTAVDRVIDFP